VTLWVGAMSTSGCLCQTLCGKTEVLPLPPKPRFEERITPLDDNWAKIYIPDLKKWLHYTRELERR